MTCFCMCWAINLRVCAPPGQPCSTCKAVLYCGLCCVVLYYIVLHCIPEQQQSQDFGWGHTLSPGGTVS